MLSSTKLSAKTDSTQNPVLLHNVEYNHARLIFRSKDSNRSVQGGHVYRGTVAYGVFCSPKACRSLVSGVSLSRNAFQLGTRTLFCV